MCISGASGRDILLIMPYRLSISCTSISAVMMKKILAHKLNVVFIQVSSADCSVADSGDMMLCVSVAGEFVASGSILLSSMAPSMLHESRMMAVFHIGVPERCCTAHSIGRLCDMRHIRASMETSRIDRVSVLMIAIGAYSGSIVLEKNTIAALPRSPMSWNAGSV